MAFPVYPVQMLIKVLATIPSSVLTNAPGTAADVPPTKLATVVIATPATARTDVAPAATVAGGEAWLCDRTDRRTEAGTDRHVSEFQQRAVWETLCQSKTR